jgi:hypothetical protein
MRFIIRPNAGGVIISRDLNARQVQTDARALLVSPSVFKCCLLKMMAFNGRVNLLFVSEMIADARWLLLQLICILQGK